MCDICGEHAIFSPRPIRHRRTVVCPRPSKLTKQLNAAVPADMHFRLKTMAYWRSTTMTSIIIRAVEDVLDSWDNRRQAEEGGVRCIRIPKGENDECDYGD